MQWQTIFSRLINLSLSRRIGLLLGFFLSIAIFVNRAVIAKESNLIKEKKVIGVEAMGMAGAWEGVCYGANAIYWNPAAMGVLPPRHFFGVSDRTTSVDLERDNPYDISADLAQNENESRKAIGDIAINGGLMNGFVSMAVAHKLGDSTLGVSFFQQNSIPDSEEPTLSCQAHSCGDLINSIQSYLATQISIAYAYSYYQLWSIGLSVNAHQLAYSKEDQAISQDFATANIGIHSMPLPFLTLALGVDDFIASDISQAERPDGLIPLWRMSIAIAIPGFPLRMSFSWRLAWEKYQQMALGFDVKILPDVYLLMGASLSDVSLGISVSWNQLRVAVAMAYGDNGELDSQLGLSLYY